MSGRCWTPPSREFGLPHHLRSDNGSPFASRGAGGLSRLSVKPIKAGVMPERIAPGKPRQNGRHERMHLTLLQEVAKPPAERLREQLKRLRVQETMSTLGRLLECCAIYLAVFSAPVICAGSLIVKILEWRQDVLRGSHTVSNDRAPLVDLAVLAS
jgi:hypothetical protein